MGRGEDLFSVAAWSAKRPVTEATRGVPYYDAPKGQIRGYRLGVDDCLLPGVRR